MGAGAGRAFVQKMRLFAWIRVNVRRFERGSPGRKNAGTPEVRQLGTATVWRMTKRFFIWLFWYVVATSIALGTFFPDGDGTLRIPTWWLGGALSILFLWWTQFLAVKYPARSRTIYVIGGGAATLMLVSGVFGS